MQVRSRHFALGFFGVLFLFIVLNVWIAHIRSDCGIQSILGLSGCRDDIRRVGFPLLVWVEGGFIYRNSFDVAALLFDIAIGLGLSIVAGLVCQRCLAKVHHPRIG